MPYLSKTELEKMGFSSLGENVLISDKVSIYNCKILLLVTMLGLMIFV